MDGWIKMYRKILDNPIATNVNGFATWTHLLLNAVHKKTTFFFNREEVTLQPGELIIGRDKFAKRIGVKASTLGFWMNYLKVNSYIDIKATNRYSIVTIKKWKDYQGVDSQVANTSTADGQQMDTYKKDKNIKKITNNSNGDAGKKSFGNSDIDYILDAYKKSIGFSPTDRYPRRVAQNIRQLIQSLIKELKVYGKDMAFVDVVDKTFDWYVNEYDMKGDTLDVVKRKARKLYEATREKYRKEGVNA